MIYIINSWFVNLGKSLQNIYLQPQMQYVISSPKKKPIRVQTLPAWNQPLQLLHLHFHRPTTCPPLRSAPFHLSKVFATIRTHCEQKDKKKKNQNSL